MLVLVALALGCPGVDAPPTLPPAEVYKMPSDFTGSWVGEVDGTSGTFSVSDLGGNRYYGLFHADDGPLQLSLSMTHVMGQGPTGPAPSNLASFTWQDGRGGRGAGWLLINREDSALTGAYGSGNDTSGMGEWTFIRVD